MGDEFMMTFFFYTVVAWLANASLAMILFISIQRGQWLDGLLNWQNRLQQWDLQGKTFLAKAGGYCELCFSHLVSFVCFWFYVLLMQQTGMWLTSVLDNTIAVVLINIVWYFVYISIATNLSLYFITKLYQK